MPSKLPKHEMNVVIGYFNVGRMEKLPHEDNNGERFLSMCQDNRLVVTNALFQKDTAKQ